MTAARAPFHPQGARHAKEILNCSSSRLVVRVLSLHTFTGTLTENSGGERFSVPDSVPKLNCRFSLVTCQWSITVSLTIHFIGVSGSRVGPGEETASYVVNGSILIDTG